MFCVFTAFTQAEQGDYTRESVAFTVLDEYNTLMQPESPAPSPATPGWEYKPNGDSTPPPAPQQQFTPQPEQQPAAPVARQTENSVSWSASEFVAHQKTGGWYVMLLLAGIVVAGLVYLLTRDFVSAGTIVVVGVILGVFAARKPRTLQYQLDSRGIHIGNKSYPYSDFKSFSMIDEGPFNSIALTPLKRFMPNISIYFEPNDEEHITRVLSSYLPFEEGKKDAIDKLMHKIRF